MDLRIEIYPRDLGVFLDFYTGVLRFSVDRDERDRPSPYVAVHRSAVRIGATPSSRRIVAEPPIAYNVVEIVLEVDDLSLERDSIISMGWPLESELTLRPWGLWDFRLRDPDGYYLRFTTPRPFENAE